MASNLLKTFEKIERGRQKCIGKANEVDFPLPSTASLDEIALCIDNQGHIDTYIKELKYLIDNDASHLDNPDLFRIPNDIKQIRSNGLLNLTVSNVIIPEYLETINSSACQNWYNFSNDLILPNTLKKIGSDVFINLGRNTGFGTLTIPNSVESMGINSFEGNGARVVNFDANITEIPQSLCEAYTGNSSATYSNYAYLEEFNISEERANKITKLGASAFKFQNNLPKLPHLPNLTEIGSYSFAGCQPTEKFTVPATWTAELGSHMFDRTWFQGGFEFEKGGVTSIDEYCFSWAEFNQEKLIFPENVYYFANYCLQYISGNTPMTFGTKTYNVIPRVDLLCKDKVSVGYGMLSSAKIGTLVIHASNLAMINSNGRVFQDTDMIKELVFPNLPATPPSIGGNVFYSGTPESIYLPDDYVATYKTASGWSTGASNMKPISQWSGYAEYLEEFGGAE